MPQNRSSAANMLRTRKRSLSTLKLEDPSLSALERIRLLDEFTMQPERELQQSSNQLVATLLDGSNWAEDGTYIGHMDFVVRDTSMHSGANHPPPLSHEESSNQPSPKRRVTVWPTTDEEATQALIGPGNPNPQYQAFYDSVSNRPLPPQPHGNGFPILGQQAPAQPGSQALGASNYPGLSTVDSATDMSTPQSFATYGPPVSGHQEPPTIAPQHFFTQVNSSFPTISTPPQPGHHYHTAETSAGGSGSINTSTNTNSQNNTIFTQGLSSDQSNTHSFVNSSSQLGSTTHQVLSPFALRYLKDDPMIVSDETRATHLGAYKKGGKWYNWQLNKLFRDWLAPDAPDSRLLIAMGAPKYPTYDDPVHDEWRQISIRHFNGVRAPASLARKWWAMLDDFAVMVASFSSTEFDSLSSLLTQLMRAVSSIQSEDNPLIPGFKASSLIAWAAGGVDGWFSLVYNRLRNHWDVAERIQLFRTKKRPSQVRSMSRASRASRSQRRPNSMSEASMEQPSTSNSASHSKAPIRPPWGEPPTQMSQSSLGYIQPPAEATEVPARIEVARDINKVTQARIDLANARTKYVNSYADTERFKLYQRYSAMDSDSRKQALQVAREVLELPASTSKMRDAAEEAFLNQMVPKLPKVEVRRILQQLEHGLPDLEELGIPPPASPPMPATPEDPAQPSTGEEPVEVLSPLPDL